MRERDGARPWWRRLVAALAPTPVDTTERLAEHYGTEIRLTQALGEDAGALIRYPRPHAVVREAARHAGERGQRLRRTLEALGRPVTEPGMRSEPRAATAWEGLRAAVGELGIISEAYLASAYSVEREHPDIATLLHEHHRATEVDRRDLIWTLAQLTPTAIGTTSPEAVAV